MLLALVHTTDSSVPYEEGSDQARGLAACNGR